MSVFTWNCQGASDKKFPSIFKSYVATYKPIIVALLEPRVSGTSADRVIRRLGFHNSHRVEANGFSGGIWLLWRDSVQVTVIANHSQFIHSEVRLNSINAPPFILTVVYGFPHPTYRRFLWQDLQPFAPDPTTPWLLSGDFNATTNSSERFGCSNHRNMGCRSFTSFIDHLGLIDLGSNGPRFTWHRGTSLARLDRALSNQSWLATFPNCLVSTLPRAKSDHSPIHTVLSHLAGSNSSTQHFRFLASWLTHPSFEALVKAHWNQTAPISANISAFSQAADSWNKDIFGHIGRKKRQLLRRLQGTQKKLDTQPFSPFLLNLERSLQEDLEETCFQEELLWIQKSSSDWVCLGDRNTSYYQTKALIRKSRNRISQLQNDDGTWLNDEADLQCHATRYFEELFSSSEPVAPHLAIRGAFPTLNQATLDGLARDISADEVKSALFEMKAFKAPGPDGLHAAFYQSQWSIVGSSLISLAQGLWRGERLDPSLNQTLIALIPSSQMW